MKFKIAARVISHLGEALISSDEVAIFELVKNGFDAGSEKIEVIICYKLSIEIVNELQKEILDLFYDGHHDNEVPTEIKNRILKRIESLEGYPQKDCFLNSREINDYYQLIKNSKSIKETIQNVGSINFIEINDHGHGMNLKTVENVFLTVGTSFRYKQLKALEINANNVPAGEKGIGRLSAMRLGKLFKLNTLAKDSTERVRLQINWRDFEVHFENEASDIDITHEVEKDLSNKNGTSIRIENLTSAWGDEQVKVLVESQLAKFMNPFNDKKKRLKVRYNGSLKEVGKLNKLYLDHCVNFFKFSLSFNKEGHALINTEFKLGSINSKTDSYTRVYTTNDFEKITDDELRKIGPFKVELYHYPRNRIKAIPGVATASEIKKNWLDHWCGGLMIFRDDLRVLPYAEKNDDWLDLDGAALRGKGFRVNRIQVVGCVHLSRLKNPKLIDQTNREGLQNNEVFRCFRRFINLHISQNFVRAVNEKIEDDSSDLNQLTSDVARESDDLVEFLDNLKSAIDKESWKEAKRFCAKIKNTTNELIQTNNLVEKALQEKMNDKLQIFELAATGLAAESIAHDLEGVIGMSIHNLTTLSHSLKEQKIKETIRYINAIQNTALKHIQLIAPVPSKSRRRRIKLDPLKVLKETATFYSSKLKENDISFTILNKLSFEVRVVEGHLKQIFDNLLRNSIEWLISTSQKYNQNKLSINISLDDKSKTLYFSDTGVGIDPIDKDWVFKAFNTRRDAGRGLGLHICRELAEFNKIDLGLIKKNKNEWGRLNTFYLTFEE